MKRQVYEALSNFSRDVRGNAAMIFALCLLPMMLVIGFAIDAGRMISAEKKMQEVTDSAVLAGARTYLDSSGLSEADQKAAAIAAAKAVFAENLKNMGAELTGDTFNVAINEDGEMSAVSNATLPMHFGGLFGRSSVDIGVNSAAMAGDARKVEVILALDNTSSMFEEQRFTKMRQAAKGFVNIMFDETPSDGLMAIGVVPWASVVNINSEAPLGWNPDAAASAKPPVYGSAKVPNEPFENRKKYLYEPLDETSYTTSQMDEDFSPVEWRGCVRAAPNERRVSSGGSVLSSLSDATIPGMRWHASWLAPEMHTWWMPPDDWSPKPGTGGPSTPPPPIPGPQGFLQLDQNALIQNAADYTDRSNQRLRCTQVDWQGGYKGVRNIYMDKRRDCATAFRQEYNDKVNACVSDPNEFEYFARGGKACEWQEDIFPWTSEKPISGPNINCPTAMLGLSGDRKQVIEKLDHMYPVIGGTQADIGLMWGLRAMSPRSGWTNFFGAKGDDAPKKFRDPKVRKIMILLTDGKNEAPYHFEGYYGCNEGNMRDNAGPCWKADGVSKLDRESLDALTLDACSAIRGEYGVELYTIAVDVNDNDAIDLLEDCAGDKSRSYNIRAAELDTTFKAIAARELRLTH